LGLHLGAVAAPAGKVFVLDSALGGLGTTSPPQTPAGFAVGLGLLAVPV